ncbi:MAG TPA: hypothetical protein DIS88_05320 [Prevotella sp.]|nr:hypothetical protein [Prevotella sp.]
MNRYIISFLLIILASPLNATLKFSHLTSINGLMQSHVPCMMQDSRGLMWIGTGNGLCVYNGYSMQTYRHQLRDSCSLPDNFIQALYQDSQGLIWVGTDKGCCCFDPRTGKFRRISGIRYRVTSFVETHDRKLYCASRVLYRIDRRHGLGTEILDNKRQLVSATQLATDQYGQIWIGGDHGLSMLHSESLRISSYSLGRPNIKGANSNHVISLFIDSKGKIWAGMNGGGLAIHDPKSGKIVYYTVSNGLAGNIVRDFGEDRNADVWIGTDSGLTIMDKQGNTKNIFQEFGNNSSLSDNAIYSIVRDDKGNMWLGTYFGGINIYKSNSPLRYYQAGSGADHMKGKVVKCLAEDSEGNILIASETGGVNILDPRKESFRNYGKGQLPTENVHSVLMDGRGQLWVGTFMGGLVRFDRKGTEQVYNTSNSVLKDNSIFALYTDPKGTLWIGTPKGLYYADTQNRIHAINKKEIAGSFVFCISGDGKGNLWLGMRDIGLIRYNPQTGSFSHWTSGSSSGSLGDNFITACLVDRNGHLWVGTNNSGLYTNGYGTEFYSFMDNGSLRDYCIYALAEDRNGNIWVTTDAGIYKYDIKGKSFFLIPVDDNIPYMHFNYSSLLVSRHGEIYAGSVNGLLEFDPSALANIRKTPNILLTGIRLMNDRYLYIDNSEPVRLGYEESRVLGIGFEAIDISHTANVSYQIMMEGIDKEWHNVVSLHEIVYSNLQPGTYVFKVRATIFPGRWDKATMRTIKITIRPPFYRSWIAYLFYILLIAVILYGIYRWLRQRQKAQRQLYEAQVEKEKEERLKNQKRDFLTEITHEFKTPLSLIVAPARQILDSHEVADTSTTDNLKLILKGANTLKGLLNKLTIINDIKDKDAELTFIFLNPMDLIDDLAKRFIPLFKNKDIMFNVDIENWGERAVFSPMAVEAIVNNLLSNAFKFTNPGGLVELSANIQAKDGGRYLKIVVADTGCGIAAEEQEKVFDKFYQVRDSNIASQGWGVGLSLVKKLVSAHKGNICLHSVPGEGSTFEVCLNVTQGAFDVSQVNDDHSNSKNDMILLSGGTITKEENQETEQAEESEDDSGKNTILIVEDNSDLLTFLANLFREYHVLCASNGEEAFKIIESNKLPDLVISDVMMPKMSGAELCARIKEDALTAHIPVVLLTAKTGIQNALEGYRKGADIYMEKPFNPSVLLLQVKNMLLTRETLRKKFHEVEDFDLKSMANNKYDEKLLQDIQKYVNDNLYNSDLCIDDIVRAVGVSRTKLHVKMKSLLGVSMGEYIKEMRIKKSKELFRKGNTIADVAFATGFSDVGYFSKCFKKKEGMTPREYLHSLIQGQGK